MVLCLFLDPLDHVVWFSMTPSVSFKHRMDEQYLVDHARPGGFTATVSHWASLGPQPFSTPPHLPCTLMEAGQGNA